ncbi:MAG: hypothetical protein FJZ87_08825 [Chloroflexi bacterium]|nr:hypothetical protein [Chloroflexota bacterium]MBM3152382.1 hypothetical protein [Chloroflexota bacterium]
MKIFLWFISRLIAVVCAILFVVTALLALLLFNLGQTLFNVKTFKEILAEVQLYEKFPALIAETLTMSISYNPCLENPLVCEEISPELRACYQQAYGLERYLALAGGEDAPTEAEGQAMQSCLDQFGPDPAADTGALPAEGGMPPYLENLTAETWEAILGAVLPPADLRYMAESALDQLAEYLDGKRETVAVPLERLKQALTSDEGMHAIVALLKNQPPCTEEEVSQFESAVAMGEIIFCSPPDDVLDVVMPQIREQLDLVAASLQDEAILIAPPGAGADVTTDSPFGGDLLGAILSARILLRLSPLLPLGFLLAITLFAVRSAKGWLRWWGIPVFVFSCLGSTIGVLVVPFFEMAWTAYVQLPPYLSPSLGELGYQVATAFVHNISEPVVLQSVILALVSLGGLVGSAFLPKRMEDGPAPAQGEAET